MTVKKVNEHIPGYLNKSHDMNLAFYKYQGTGNDFIIVNNLRGKLSLDCDEIAFLCNRHFGIGADGLMIIEQAAGYDYYLKYYNSDGHESSMCGNGGRCSAAFAYRIGVISEVTSFLAADGPHEAEILNSDPGGCDVRLKMKDTRLGKEFSDGYFIDTGSPHFVKFVSSLESLNVPEEGRLLRFDQRFAPGGTNVNFVENDKDRIWVRTYERGVENETLSCGTGATASALVLAALNPRDNQPLMIHTTGGNLKISFSRKGDDFTNVYLEGPARFVFAGEISLSLV